ncbi:MAG: glycosyltransferase family 39 protein, partial [Candidatus Omnitrophica bacterium]|nr:glycosyltransferase family 39 protein [Candidatus Omnitrophota bacterium]
ADFRHPALPALIIGSFFKVFGSSLWVGHIVSLLFSFITLWFTYKLGCYIADRTVGIYSSLLLLASPLFFTQSAMLTRDVFFTAFSTMAVYYTVRGRLRGYLFAAACAVLTKASAIALIALCSAHFFSRYDKNQRIKILLFALSPVLLYAAWACLYKIRFGSFIPKMHIGYVDLNFSMIISRLIQRSKALFLDDFKWLLVSFSSAAICFNPRVRLKPRQWGALKFFAVFIAGFLLFFAVIRSDVPWYLLFLYPVIFVSSLTIIYHLWIRRYAWQSLLAATVAAAFVSSWYTGRTDLSHGALIGAKMNYLDLVYADKQAMRFLEDNYGNDAILAVWPQSLEMSFPLLGYVSKPLNVINTLQDYNKADLILYSPQSGGPNSKLYESIIARVETRLVRRFQSHGKEAYIYKLIKGNIDNVTLVERELPWIEISRGGFTIDDQPFRFIGANTVYFGFYDNYGLNIEEAIRSAKENGISVIRIYLWLGRRPWGYGTMREYDRVLDIAARNGLYVIVTLTDCCPGDWGKTEKAYFTAVPHCNAASQGGTKLFKNHIRRILMHKNTINGRVYRNDPTILAWDIANEPQAPYFDYSVFRDWLRAISGFIKRLDRNHLVTVGIEATSETYDSDGAHYDVFNIPDIDFLSFHFHPFSRYTVKEAASPDKYLNLIRFRINKFLSMQKAVILGEINLGNQRMFGPPQGNNNWLKNYKRVIDAAFSFGASGVMFWGWGVPETGNLPLWWKNDDHDTTEKGFCALIKQYRIPLHGEGAR